MPPAVIGVDMLMPPLTLNASAPKGTFDVPLVVIIVFIPVVVSDKPCEPNTLDAFNSTDGALEITALPDVFTVSATGEVKPPVGRPIRTGLALLPIPPDPEFKTTVCPSSGVVPPLMPLVALTLIKEAALVPPPEIAPRVIVPL